MFYRNRIVFIYCDICELFDSPAFFHYPHVATVGVDTVLAFHYVFKITELRVIRQKCVAWEARTNWHWFQW
jgi:hypothetical protein